MIESRLSRNAERLVDSSSGGFPEQEQEPPGLTAAMDPIPDHGEHTYEGSGKLKGMRALITGGDSGIGRAVAIAYAREGADIAVSYLPEEQQDADETCRYVTDAGQNATLVPADLREHAACERLVEQVVAELGGLEILVNNAGFQMARSRCLQDITTEQLDRTLKTNLYALIWVTQEALPHLKRGASIINNTSIQAYEPSTSLLDYAATKSAINNFTVNLAGELGSRGIRVNAVAPGPVWTPLQPATQPGHKLKSFGADTPLGRAGQPGEVAPAFVFLASPADASYISGTVLGVTGGKAVF